MNEYNAIIILDPRVMSAAEMLRVVDALRVPAQKRREISMREREQWRAYQLKNRERIRAYQHEYYRKWRKGLDTARVERGELK